METYFCTLQDWLLFSLFIEKTVLIRIVSDIEISQIWEYSDMHTTCKET